MGWFDSVMSVPQGFANGLGFGLPPATPDFRGAAEQTAQANRPNVNGPFASQSWTQGPDGQWTMSNGFQGPLAGAAAGWGAQAQQAAGMGMPDPTQARNQAIGAAYDQATSRLDPQWAQRQEAMDAQLANQGLDPTSEAAQVARQQFGQARNDAYSSAMNGAIGQGTEAGSALFGQGMAARQLPLAQLLAMNQLQQTPQFHEGPNYLGAEGMRGAYDMSRWQGQNQQNADLIRGAEGWLQGNMSVPFAMFGGGMGGRR